MIIANSSSMVYMCSSSFVCFQFLFFFTYIISYVFETMFKM